MKHPLLQGNRIEFATNAQINSKMQPQFMYISTNYELKITNYVYRQYFMD